jgi:hypothetical protein
MCAARVFIKFVLLTFTSYTVGFHIKGENELRVFENSVLRKIFRPMRKEVTGDWRKLHFLTCNPHKIFDDQIKETVICETFFLYGGEEKYMEGVGVGKF